MGHRERNRESKLGLFLAKMRGNVFISSPEVHPRTLMPLRWSLLCLTRLPNQSIIVTSHCNSSGQWTLLPTPVASSFLKIHHCHSTSRPPFLPPLPLSSSFLSSITELHQSQSSLKQHKSSNGPLCHQEIEAIREKWLYFPIALYVSAPLFLLLEQKRTWRPPLVVWAASCHLSKDFASTTILSLALSFSLPGTFPRARRKALESWFFYPLVR